MFKKVLELVFKGRELQCPPTSSEVLEWIYEGKKEHRDLRIKKKKEQYNTYRIIWFGYRYKDEAEILL